MKTSKFAKAIAIMAFAFVALTGCTRVETGEVGLRTGIDKQVNMTELQPGSFNQTILGSVDLFPVRDISFMVENQTPQTKDNSRLKDFDAMVVYNIVPSSVGEIYTTKSRGFHQYDGHEIYLMYNYMVGIAQTAAGKAVRLHDAMKVADDRDAIEKEMLDLIRAALKEEKLDTSVVVTQVKVRAVQPADEIVRSANNALTAANDLKTKTIEVQTAQAEALKQQALAAGSTDKSIAMINAQSFQAIAEGVKAGKVNTILIPHNMTMFGGTGK